MSNSTATEERCLLAQSFVMDARVNAARFVQLLLGTCTFILFAWLLREYKRSPVAFHGNLLLLFGNIVFVYVIYAADTMLMAVHYLTLFLFLGQESPACSAMIPLWLVALIRVPQYFELLFLPLIHFSVMLERVRATLFAERYEREGLWFALTMLALIWTASILFACFIFLTTLAYSRWNIFAVVSFPTMVVPSNAPSVLILHCILLALTLGTILVDWKVVLVNRRQRSSAAGASGYSLSRLYQINENIVTMRLILPLDIAYGAIFVLYFTGALLLRSLASSLSTLSFEVVYEWLNSMVILHALFTFWLYIRFIVNGRKNRLRIKPAEQQAEIYFKELREQWGASTNQGIGEVK